MTIDAAGLARGRTGPATRNRERGGRLLRGVWPVGRSWTSSAGLQDRRSHPRQKSGGVASW